MRLKHVRMLLACLTAPLLSSCAQDGKDSCLLFTAVYISAQDQLTDLTSRQILANNEVGAKKCGWKAVR